MRILRSSLFVAAIAIIAAACYEPPREEPARIVYVPIYEYRQESCFGFSGYYPCWIRERTGYYRYTQPRIVHPIPPRMIPEHRDRPHQESPHVERPHEPPHSTTKPTTPIIHK